MTTVHVRYGTELNNQKAVEYMRTHDAGQTQLWAALAQVMDWQDAYRACFAYVGFVCDLPQPTITFE